MWAAAVLILFVLAAGSCTSTSAPVGSPAVPQPVAPSPAEPAPEPPPLPPAPPPPPAPEPPQEPPAPAPASEFTVSVEVYNRTFDEIQAVIDELNGHIARGEYEGWLEHLTENYVRETSKPEFLERWKDDPELKRRGIVLRTLKDFFVYRVVPTRTVAKVDEIQFVDDEHVYAFTVLRGEKYLLYSLVKTATGWKVDFY